MFQHPWEPLPDHRAISERAAHEHALTVAVRDERLNRRRDAISHLREWVRSGLPGCLSAGARSVAPG